MPSAFNFAASPFDCLAAAERQLVRDSVDIAYFREHEVILGPGVPPDHLYVVIKGHVRQFDGDEHVHTYGPDDSFDGRALIAGAAGSRFVAGDEVLAYQLAKQAVSTLILRNATFGALLLADVSKKLGALAERDGRHELRSLGLARVEQATVRPLPLVDGETDIVSVVRLFQAERTGNVLVEDRRVEPARIGIFTTSGLQRAILHGTPLAELAVRELASFELVKVRPADPLYDALALMIRHKVHRVVVAEAVPPTEADEAPRAAGKDPLVIAGAQGSERILGVLDQLDLLSFLSNHSYPITRAILEARDVDALARAAAQIHELIVLLHRGGTRVALIARLVQELNDKLFERAWELLAPADLVAHSCLFVMGSEGRGEQLLKTDQDNGLVLRDGYQPPADLPAICERFSSALARFGYPPCPGGIMLSRPAWRQTAAGFAQTIRRWLLERDAERLMALAILVDARAVCGDPALLEAVRAARDDALTDNDALMARFAAAIDAFDHGTGWWSRLLALGEGERERMDLKKAGIFPLVHGIRSMALEHGLVPTGTVARIEALVAAGRLPAELAPELIESLHFFMRLQLEAGLEAIEFDRPGDRSIDVTRLSALDRDLLKDTLGVVKRFRAMLRHRYRLDAL